MLHNLLNLVQFVRPVSGILLRGSLAAMLTCTCPLGPIVPDSSRGLWLLTHWLEWTTWHRIRHANGPLVMKSRRAQLTCRHIAWPPRYPAHSRWRPGLQRTHLCTRCPRFRDWLFQREQKTTMTTTNTPQQHNAAINIRYFTGGRTVSRKTLSEVLNVAARAVHSWPRAKLFSTQTDQGREITYLRMRIDEEFSDFVDTPTRAVRNPVERSGSWKNGPACSQSERALR